MCWRRAVSATAARPRNCATMSRSATGCWRCRSLVARSGGCLHLDLLWCSLRDFGKNDRQHAIGDVRADLAAINARRNDKRALEHAIASFGQVIAFLLALLGLLLLAPDRQQIVGQH